MKLVLKEYIVTPFPNKREELNIIIEDNTITYNNNTITDENKIKELESLFEREKDKIKSLKNIEHSNYKGGKQKNLYITDNEETIHFIGNTNNEEIANYYEYLKNNILSIIS